MTVGSCPHAREFARWVNMTPSAIRAWARDPRASCASWPETRARLDALADLRAKDPARWTATDCAFAARVVSFNARMSGGMRRDGCTTGYAVSLRNWGHAPASCPAPASCRPKRRRR